MSQAKHIADAFEKRPDLIIVSPYFRTQQTASPLIDKFPDTPVETWALQEFCYLCPDSCKNSTAEARKPLVDKYWNRCDESYRDGPGAESFFEFKNRIICQLQLLKERREKHIVIFTHGQVMQLLLLYLQNENEEISMEHFRNRMPGFKIENSAILSFIWDKQAGWIGKDFE